MNLKPGVKEFQEYFTESVSSWIVPHYVAKQAFKKSLPPDESNEHLFPGLDHLHAVDGLAKEASLRLTRILAPFQNQDSSRSCVEKKSC